MANKPKEPESPLDPAVVAQWQTARGEPPRRKGPNWSSLGFFALSFVLAVLAILLATGKVRIGGTPPPPPVAAGHAMMIDVIDVLQAQGLQVEQSQGFVPRGVLATPGQGVKINGEDAFVFVFEDPAAADAGANVDPAKVLESVSPDTSSAWLAHGSNIIVATATTDDGVRQKIAAALEQLPT